MPIAVICRRLHRSPSFRAGEEGQQNCAKPCEEEFGEMKTAICLVNVLRSPVALVALV